jgi:RHS repeat-associated protein
VVAEYVWGSLGPVARIAGGRVQLYVCDALGHVRALIDAETGQITDRYDYDAWGNVVHNGSTRQPFTWNGAYGYEWIPETGLYHVGARAYDPRTARWLQRDPIDAASGDPNLYRYAGNDPVNCADPTGLKVMVAEIECVEVAPARKFSSDSSDWLDKLSNFFAGWGDTLTFGLTGKIRQGLGLDSVVDYNSSWYRGGEWTGLAHSTFMGAAGGFARNSALRGLRRSNSAFPRGIEFVEASHWIPARYHWIPTWVRNGPLNIKYMWASEHALCDPYRYRFMPRWWKRVNRPHPNWLGIVYRTPSSVSGACGGAVYGGVSVSLR